MKSSIYGMSYCGHRDKLSNMPFWNLPWISANFMDIYTGPRIQKDLALSFPFSNWHPCSHITYISQGSAVSPTLLFFLYPYSPNIFKLCNYPTITYYSLEYFDYLPNRPLSYLFLVVLNRPQAQGIINLVSLYMFLF